MKPRNALLIIDVQNDVFKGGVIAAKNTGTLIKPLNLLIKWALNRGYVCIFTRDWHPWNHCSFITQGGPWPPHCIQGTYGAKFAEGLFVPDSSFVVDIEKDPGQSNVTYSAFENSTLIDDLHRYHVRHIVAAGIATEYCVKATVLEAIHHGFTATVLRDLVRPINVRPGDAGKALKEMSRAGATVMKSTEWISTREVRSIS